MSAVETATDGIAPIERPTPDEVTGWLLDGRWFTIDTGGRITAWSPAAAERFGWQRSDVAGESFAETLLAEPAAGTAVVEALMDGGTDGGAGFTGELDAVDSDGGSLRAAFALVPIQLSVGYEFNALLQEVSSRSVDEASLGELRARHESVLELIESALSGKAAESAQTEEGGRLAGALVVFRAAEAATANGRAGMPDNVVSIADAAGLEEARGQVERSRKELEEARVELRSLEGQLDEARREAQRSRNEADVARQEANDARDALVVAQRQVEEVQRQVDDARRGTDSARADAEAARMHTEESQREADRLRAELNEARVAMRRSVDETDSELVSARTDAERARSEAAEQRAAAARHVAEVESLRGRLQETQRELGVLRAELEAARAEQAQGAAVAERRADETERLRSELEAARSELENARAENASLRAVNAGTEMMQAVDLDAPVVDAELAEADDGLTVEAVRRALEEEMFELHAQPVLDLRTNDVAQYELLIRMVGDGGRLVLPQAFLEPARRAGLAHAIDRWVVREAIGLLAHTPETVRLEVNLSPEAVHDAELPALIDAELASTPIDPGRLVLEVTGATAADDLEAARTLAKRIRGLGCRFALDDFRSTFGSFRLLKDLPLDYLKLDGELVGSLTESRTSQLIVKALVDVAAGTGAKTVAVFVSDEQTLGMLRQQGVDFAQGYAVGRPRPIADVWPGDEPAQLPPAA